MFFKNYFLLFFYLRTISVYLHLFLPMCTDNIDILMVASMMGVCLFWQPATVLQINYLSVSLSL